MLPQATFQVGKVVHSGCIGRCLVLLRVILQFDGGQLDQLPPPWIGQERALSDLDGASAHPVQREGRVGFDLIRNEGVRGVESARLIGLSRVLLASLLLFVAVLPALAIGQRGIKLLFAHKYYSSTQSIKMQITGHPARDVVVEWAVFMRIG
jgi:hypothetical protein